MKRTIRGLGIGLFLAGATYTTLDYLETPATPETATEYKATIQELEAKLKTAKEQISLFEKQAVADKPATSDENTAAAPEETKTAPTEQPENTEATPNETEDEQDDSSVVSGTVYIYEGVSLYDIGKQAEDAGIIQSSRELELFLAKPEYAKTIQKGQFDLTSDMTIEEMARVLTGKSVEN